MPFIIPRGIDWIKQQVRSRTQSAIETGQLQLEPCARCGTRENVEAHHLRYDGPDAYPAVEWMCRSCHAVEHGIIRERSSWRLLDG